VPLLQATELGSETSKTAPGMGNTNDRERGLSLLSDPTSQVEQLSELEFGI